MYKQYEKLTLHIIKCFEKMFFAKLINWMTVILYDFILAKN